MKITAQSFVQNVLSHSLIRSIAELKSTYWKYPVESQIEWIRSHTKPDDIHVVLRDADVVCGYLRLVTRTTEKSIQFSGVSTVIVDSRYRGQQLGKMLIQETNRIIDERGHFGLLCCRSETSKFYKSCGWRETGTNVLNSYGEPFFLDEKVLVYGNEDLDNVTHVDGETF